mgnify:CR=1 FL=1
MTASLFKGVITPLLTPIDQYDQVHEKSLKNLVKYQLSGGVHGLWASGTSSEFPSLDEKERVRSIQIVVDEVNGEVPVIGNVTMPSTQLTVELAKQIMGNGVSAIAATPPYYFSHTQIEIADHYRAIRQSVDLPLWIYNIPSMHKTPVAPSTVATLASESVISGIKDSSGTGELLTELHILRDRMGFGLCSTLGTSLRVGVATALGAQGVIPALANVVPGLFVDIWNFSKTGDIKKIKSLNEKVMIALQLGLLGKSGSSQQGSIFSGYKKALVELGVIEFDYVTKPFKALTASEALEIPLILDKLNISADLTSK